MFLKNNDPSEIVLMQNDLATETLPPLQAVFKSCES